MSVPAEDALPRGWFAAGSKPANYEFGVDDVVTQQSAKSACIKRRDALPEVDGGFGTLMQTIAADSYRGQRLRLSGYVKTREAGGAAIWMRVDGPNGVVLSFDNMGDRAITGTADWKLHDIVLEVPQSAAAISFGFFLRSDGAVWADRFKLEPVDDTVQVTARTPTLLPKAPVNLDFDE